MPTHHTIYKYWEYDRKRSRDKPHTLPDTKHKLPVQQDQKEDKFPDITIETISSYEGDSGSSKSAVALSKRQKQLKRGGTWAPVESGDRVDLVTGFHAFGGVGVAPV